KTSRRSETCATLALIYSCGAGLRPANMQTLMSFVRPALLDALEQLRGAWADGVRCVGFKMQLRHAEELQPAGDFPAKKVSRAIEHGQRIFRIRPIPHGDADKGMALVGRDLNLGHRSRPHARIGQLEADQFGQFLAE